MLDAELAVANKSRPRHEVAAVTQVIGDVHGKVALIGDDMIVTGGTTSRMLTTLGRKQHPCVN